MPESLGSAIVKANCVRVRLSDEVDSRSVNYALQRADLRRAITSQLHGVGRPRLGMAGIKALPVPLAPRVERERIVAVLEEHLSRLDAVSASVLEHRPGGGPGLEDARRARPTPPHPAEPRSAPNRLPSPIRLDCSVYRSTCASGSSRRACFGVVGADQRSEDGHFVSGQESCADTLSGAMSVLSHAEDFFQDEVVLTVEVEVDRLYSNTCSEASTSGMLGLNPRSVAPMWRLCSVLIRGRCRRRGWLLTCLSCTG